MSINRFIVIVLDSVGIGEGPDAATFGDVGSHTLGNIARVAGGLNLPHMEAMGLANIAATALNLLGFNQLPDPDQWVFAFSGPF